MLFRSGLFDTVESALVHAAFERAHHNQVRTAKVLGVTRNMVRTLLKRHGLLASAGGDIDHEGDPDPDPAANDAGGSHRDAAPRALGRGDVAAAPV